MFKLDRFRFRNELGRHWLGSRVVDGRNRLPEHTVLGLLVLFEIKLDELYTVVDKVLEKVTQDEVLLLRKVMT